MRCSAVWVAGCWSRNAQMWSYPSFFAPTDLLQLNFEVVLSSFLLMVTPNHARGWPGSMNKMHKMFLISI